MPGTDTGTVEQLNGVLKWLRWIVHSDESAVNIKVHGGFRLS